MDLQQIDTGSITAGGLILVAGILQTFALEYLPWVADKYGVLEPRKKKSVNALVLAIITLAAYALSLANVINGFTPDLQGAVVALTVYFTALGIGQGVHAGTKKE